MSISIDSEDAQLAEGTVYSHAETTRDGVASLAAMRYDDIYSKKEGSWKFSKGPLISLLRENRRLSREFK